MRKQQTMVAEALELFNALTRGGTNPAAALGILRPAVQALAKQSTVDSSKLSPEERSFMVLCGVRKVSLLDGEMLLTAAEIAAAGTPAETTTEDTTDGSH